MKACLAAALAALAACGTPTPTSDHSPGSTPPVTAPAPAVALDATAPVPVTAAPAVVDATPLLRQAGARGAVLALDVETGAAVAHGAVDRDPSATVLPLSVVKLYTAALWWDQNLGDGDFPHPRPPKRSGSTPQPAGSASAARERVTVHDMLVQGYDRPGELLALELRRRLTGERVLAELRRYGLGPALTLPADADDATWGSTLSIGESSMAVTLETVSTFLRAIGRSELVRPDTARRLHAAMRDTVTHGTARSAAARVPAGWHLGGKTGTGPAARGKPYDGWFAGLIFDGDRSRYTIAVYIDRGGLGGGLAASLAADVTHALATSPAHPAPARSP